MSKANPWPIPLLPRNKMNQTLPEQQILRGYISERKRAERMRKVGMWAWRIAKAGFVILAAFLLWRYR